MSDPCSGADPVNTFALVAYVPGPLGAFLDELRTRLEPNTLSPRAHVTVLPPRPLASLSMAEEAADFIERRLPDFPPIDVALGDVEVFPGTNVVYVAVPQAFAALKEMHRYLNAGPVAYRECYEYHPHITIAQKLEADQAVRVAARATEALAAWRGRKSFLAESFTFVQALRDDRWRDLREYTSTACQTASVY